MHGIGVDSVCSLFNLLDSSDDILGIVGPMSALNNYIYKRNYLWDRVNVTSYLKLP